MKVKSILPSRTKKIKASKKLEHTASVEDTLRPSQSEETSLSSAGENKDENKGFIDAPNGVLRTKFSNELNGSSLSLFAMMSSTIADNLPENEHSRMKNNVTSSYYHRNADPVDIRVEHPVVCKRDIFVHTVTPPKRKGRRMSIYRYKEKESEALVKPSNLQERFSSEPEPNTATTHSHSKADNSSQVLSRTDNNSLAHSKADNNSQTLSKADGTSVLPSCSVSGSMLFRQKNNLKIETGRIERGEDMIPINPQRLHNAPPEQHQGRTARDWGRPPRFAGSLVSPSSTVSSLTMPAELDTPKRPRTSQSLQDINEKGDIMSTSASIEGMGELSEI